MPFIDGYERSKQLKDGEPGKSKTLEDVVGRLKAILCADPPPAFPIHVKFNSKADKPEYDNKTGTIAIHPQDSWANQIENFAHEGFHASHQFLSKLYDHGVVSKDTLVNIWLEGEAKSMLTEVGVHRELGLKGDYPQSHFIRDGREDRLRLQAGAGMGHSINSAPAGTMTKAKISTADEKMQLPRPNARCTGSQSIILRMQCPGDDLLGAQSLVARAFCPMS